ncbi:hypothetical protein ACFQZ4_37100 [Catellatospora coxensis]|uniref:Uncharacterized protein n=1 Tax=Catellatospora coxensis TaxID=310354 RepID=A0A8J3KUU0_9ACTN|nr:hypothetical protein [Catellatospora coxensis]GIG03789.1 hypothetical protein Cco03nite_04890 [Catellatospora coxensis]
MTATAPPSAYTASWLLSGNREETRRNLASIATGMARNGILGQLSDQIIAALSDELARATDGLLDFDLGPLLQHGLQVSQALAAAGRATADNPGTVELVELAGHTVSVAHEPAVDIAVNGVVLATLALQLSVVIELKALLGRVTEGKLVELQVASCTATADLHCEGVRLAGGRAEMAPAYTKTLGRGLTLARAASLSPQAEDHADA